MNVFDRVVEFFARCQNVSAKPSLFPNPLVRRNFDAQQNIGYGRASVWQQDSMPVIGRKQYAHRLKRTFIRAEARASERISPKIAGDKKEAKMEFQAA